jgi:hypothetical protein
MGILVAIAVLAAAIAALAPAALVGVALERESGGRLALAGTEGTVWRGRGTLVSGNEFRLPLAWSIAALPLATGELRLRLAPHAGGGSTPAGEFALRTGAIAARALDVTLPADLVLAAAPRAGVRASGDMRLVSASLGWTDSFFTGSARLAWHDARLAVGGSVGTSLGNVLFMLSAAGDRLAGPVSNDGGDLEIRGTVSVSTRGATDVSLVLTPRRDDPALARQLASIGTAEGSGWRVDFRSGPR